MNNMTDTTAKGYHEINVKNLKTVKALVDDLRQEVASLQEHVKRQDLNIATMQGTIANQNVQIAVLHSKWMGTGATTV